MSKRRKRVRRRRRNAGHPVAGAVLGFIAGGVVSQLIGAATALRIGGLSIAGAVAGYLIGR